MSAVAEKIGAYRVYLIEPQVVLAKALSHLFAAEPSIMIVGDAQELDLEDVCKAQPEIILFDGDYDPGLMMASLRELKAEHRLSSKICILSMYLDAERAVHAISAGADGYIVKDIAPHELYDSFYALMRDGIFVDPRLSSILLRRRIDRTWTSVEHLSPRETEVVRLIAQGLSNKEISSALMLSDKTVRNHVSNIFSKLNCTARTQVAIHAIRHGIA